VKRILYLTDQMLTVFLIRGRELLGKQMYEPDAEGVAAFDRDIGQAPEIPNRLVLDITEEEFYIEKVPHVFVHDQRKILERRRMQRFGNSSWVRMEKQGRDREGRRDDLFLFSGITRGEVLQPWLAALRRHCSPLDTVTSVSLLSCRLYRSMHLKQKHVLFVSHGEAGGIRQSYLVDGRLKHSRLAPTPRMTERAYADHFLQEMRRMGQFLSSGGTLPYDQTLHVYLLGSNEVIAILGKEFTDVERIRIHGYNLLALERKFGFRGIGRGEQADAFYALLAATGKRLPGYTTHEDRIGFYHHRARQALLAASVAMFFAGTAFMGYAMDRMVTEKETLQRVKYRIASEQSKLDALERRLARYDATGFEMEDAVLSSERLQKLGVRPFDWFALVGNQLLKHDAIRLNKLNFYVAPVPEEPAETTDWMAKLGVEVMEEDEGQPQEQEEPWVEMEMETDEMPEESRPPGPRPAPVIVLEGVMEEGRSFRLMMEDFRSLVGELEANPRLARVVVEKWPVEIRSDRALDMQQTRFQAELPFSFKLVLVGRALL